MQMNRWMRETPILPRILDRGLELKARRSDNAVIRYGSPDLTSVSTTSDNASAGPEILLASGGKDWELPGRAQL